MLAALTLPLLLVPPTAATAATATALTTPATSTTDATSRCAGVLVVVQGAAERADSPRSTCTDRAGTAAAAFDAAGLDLERVQRFPGAVCRVDGEPADAGCVAMPPDDAYWGLFSAEDGRWRYATRGVDALDLARGDAVALVWQDSPAHTPPSVRADTPGDPAGSTGASGHPPTTTGLPGWVPAPILAAAALAVVLLLRRRRRT